MARGPVLFATDFSSASDAALPHAASLAKEAGARLVIVHVEEPPLAYGGGELYYGLPEPNSAAIAAMLERVKPADPGVAFEHRMAMGNPADEIVQLARDEEASLIGLATHGRSGFSRLLMGSVAEVVVRRAPCPVLVYRQPIEKISAGQPVLAPA